MDIDIDLNRKALKYSHGEMLRRILWGLAKPLFRFSPRMCFGWRRLLLRLLGAKIGKRVNIYNSAVVYMPWNLEVGEWAGIGEEVLIYNLGKITIGKSATISHRAHLCAGSHDYTRSDLPLLKPPIVISDQAWVCADAFIGPGVVIGQGAVVAARAVAVKDVPAWTVAAGNPARIVKKRKVTGYAG